VAENLGSCVTEKCREQPTAAKLGFSERTSTQDPVVMKTNYDHQAAGIGHHF